MKAIKYLLLFALFINKIYGGLTRLRLQQQTREQLSKDGKENFDKHIKSIDKLKKLSAELHGNKYIKDDKNEEVKHTPFENAALFQGDMILSPEHAKLMIEEAKIKVDAKKQGKNITDKDVVEKLKKNRAFQRNMYYRWEFPIPYYVEPGVDASIIDAGLKDIEKNSCVRFQKSGRFQGRSGLRFFRGGGCYSAVGRVKPNQVQDVSIGNGCGYIGVVGHETFHALGFQHEQSRPDRDQYIQVVFNNIIPNLRFNFDIYGADKTDTMGVPYNYGSAMQYGRTAFSPTGADTMIAKNKLYVNTIGNSEKMQFLDFKALNLAYCKNKCNGGVQCENGGYENPNQCGTCLCPFLLTGTTCNEYIKNPPACGNQNVIKLSGSPVSIRARGPYKCVYAVSAPGRVRLTFGYTNMLIRSDKSCHSGDGVEAQYLNDKTFTGVTFCGNSRGRSIVSEGPLMLVKFTGHSNNEMADMTFQAV
uniref:Zinc metalloproteinase n=1 Tax=Parastrongyloides trichosuri TaxID=131310 RepID=A0A0N4Z1H2_PARTI